MSTPGVIRARIVRKSGSLCSIVSLSIGGALSVLLTTVGRKMGTKTKYQQWKESGGRLTPLPVFWQTRRERLPTQLLTSRPYLKESVADGGDEFSIASFLGLLLFFLIIGSWLYSARGVVGGLFHYVTGDTPAFSAPVLSSEKSQPPNLFRVTDGKDAPAPAESVEVVEEVIPDARPDVRRTGGGSASLGAFFESLARSPMGAIVAVLVIAGLGLVLVGLGLRRIIVLQEE